MCACFTPDRPKAPLATLEDDGLDDDEPGLCGSPGCQPGCRPECQGTSECVQTWTDQCTWETLRSTIREQRFCPRFCYSFTCTCGTYLLLGVTFVCGIILMIIFGTSLIAPPRRSLRFVPTTCHVDFSNKTLGTAVCTCGRRCTAKYDCLTIYGHHDVIDADNITYTIQTTLYDTEYDLDDGLCSYKPTCSRIKSYRKGFVDNYRRQWGSPGSYYTCYFDPRDPSLVFRKRSGSHSRMVDMILWPTAMIIISGFGLFFRYQGLERSVGILSCGQLWKDEKFYF